MILSVSWYGSVNIGVVAAVAPCCWLCYFLHITSFPSMQFYVQDNISAALHKLLVLLPVGLGLQIILSFPFNFW